MLQKFTLSVVLGILLMSAFSVDVKASHAAGGELVYEWVSGSTYRFYFKFYRDCSGSPEPPNARLCILNQCTGFNTFRTMTKMTTLPTGGTNGSQVSTGCANQKSRCDSVGSNIPGYEEWWYSVDYTLPTTCTSWRFSVIVPVRNSADNVNGTPNFYVETFLDNVNAAGNNSPVFTVKPVPYVCVNQFYSYNNGGIDPDGDSVAFEVLQPLDAGSCFGTPNTAMFQTATPPYSIPTNPFQTNNSFTLSASTGELSFTPGVQGANTVTVRAKEYRNGTLIGSVMRDIQVQVIPCNGSNVTPTLNTDPSTISGGSSSGGIIYGCAKSPLSFCFDIKSTSSVAKLVASDNSATAMPGSIVTYQNLQTDSVRACVNWTPSPTDTGIRVFVVTVKDSSCSSTGVAISHSITVPVYINTVTAAIRDTNICLGDSVELIGVGGTTYTWTVVPGGSPISTMSCTSCKTPIVKPTTTTRYVVSSNSSSVCNVTSDTAEVTVISQTTTATSNSPVCPGSTLSLFAPANGVDYIWTGPNGFTSNLQNPTIPNAQAANAGFYSLRITNGACTSQAFLMQVFVNQPAGPSAGSNSPVCLGTQLILTASTVSGTTVSYEWTGPNGFTSKLQTPVISNATFANAGKYKVYAIIDGCESFSDSVTVAINAAPGAPTATGGPLTYCQDDVAPNLTAIGTSLKWYNVSTGGAGSATLAPSTTTAGVFKYYVSQTVGGCEGPRDSITVNIIAKPAPPTTNQTVTYCQGATATALTATGTNIKWYAVPIGGAPLTNAPTPSTATAGTVIYYVSQTNTTTGCESDRIPVSVTVYATPITPLISSPAEYCEGGPVSPALSTFVTGTNLKWYTVATGGVGTTTVPTVNTSVPGVDTYYISQTINGCEGVRGILIVEVIAKPTPPQTRDTAYCQFTSPAQLTAIGQNLLWYAAATGGTGSTTAPTLVATTPGIFKFYVSQTINGCESERDSIAVTIYAKPQPPVGNDDSICESSNAAALTATGSNLLWYTVPVGGIGTSVAPTPSTSSTGTFNWYVSQSINGCESDRDTVTIYVKAKPVRPEADSAEFCLNAPTKMLTATGVDLLWYNVATGGVGSTTAIQPSTAVRGVFNYFVSQTIDGCESDRDTAVVVVDTLVSINIKASLPYFCQGDTIEVSQTGFIPDSAVFVWGWDGATVLSGDTSGPYQLKWNSAGIKTITLNADDNGCKANDTTTVEVLPAPQAYFNAADEICIDKGIDIVIDSVLANATKFNWSYDNETNAAVSADSNKFSIKWETIGEKIISLQTVSDSGCLSATYSDTVSVRDYPKPRIEPLTDYELCTRTEIDVKVTPLTDGVYTYNWTPSDYFLTRNASTVKARITSSGYIKVTATDEYGCSGSDSVHMTVKLCCKAVVPSAFSPNGDGKNDKFGIISTGNYKIYTFRVVNRYGRVVFSTNNQSDRWDGTFNGEPQDLGVYYYFIKYTCEDDNGDNQVEERGDVTLIR